MFKGLLGFLGIGGEDKQATGHRGLAFLLVIPGVGLVLPGPKEALVAAASLKSSGRLAGIMQALYPT